MKKKYVDFSQQRYKFDLFFLNEIITSSKNNCKHKNSVLTLNLSSTKKNLNFFQFNQNHFHLLQCQKILWPLRFQFLELAVQFYHLFPHEKFWRNDWKVLCQHLLYRQSWQHQLHHQLNVSLSDLNKARFFRTCFVEPLSKYQA